MRVWSSWLYLVACKQASPPPAPPVLGDAALAIVPVAIDAGVADAAAPADAALDDLAAITAAPLLLYRESYESPMGVGYKLYRLERQADRFTMTIDSHDEPTMPETKLQEETKRLTGSRSVGSGEVLKAKDGTGYWCKAAVLEIGARDESDGYRHTDGDCRTGRIPFLPPTKIAALQCWPLDEKGGKPHLKLTPPPGLDSYGWSGVHCDGQHGYRWIPADGRFRRE
jgi:hypothetical protein